MVKTSSLDPQLMDMLRGGASTSGVERFQNMFPTFDINNNCLIIIIILIILILFKEDLMKIKIIKDIFK